MRKACKDWLAKWAANFGTRDGLPGEFHRAGIFDMLGPQMAVAVVTPHGSVLTGRTVMKGPAGWVAADDRTRGACPLICNETNTVWTSGLYFKGAELKKRGQ